MTRVRQSNSTLHARTENRLGSKPPRERRASAICPRCRLFAPTDVEDDRPDLVCQCGSEGWGEDIPPVLPDPRRQFSSLSRSSEPRTHAASGKPKESAPKPRKPIAPVSANRTAENRIRRDVLRAMFEADPWCRARIADVCDGLAVDGHEVLSRARGGSITDEANVVLLCRNCHTHITQEPAWAEANGWSLSQYRPTDAPEVA